jgi:transposase
VCYLGTADMLMARLLASPAGCLRIRSVQHGDLAALKAAADRLDLVSIIDRHVPRGDSKVSVGTTLLLGALNRAIHPRSKRGWSGWAAGTSLPRLFDGIKLDKLTSQFFWDQMNRVPIDALGKIESDLAAVVVKELEVQLDTLFYDTTNFFTYIASTNAKPKLPQRGKSKQKRSDLRLFGLALLVSRDGEIPLFSHVYEGNRADAKLFPDALSRIRSRLAELSVDVKDLTLVYDRGNLSKANQAEMDQSSFGYVAALTPAHHLDLMAIPTERYEKLPQGTRLAGIPALRLRREIWGAERTTVLFVSEKLREGQIRGLEQHLTKRLGELVAWKAELKKPRSGPKDQQSADHRIAQILSGQHVRDVLHVQYDPNRTGEERLTWSIDDMAKQHLANEVFGKRILITNRDSWSTEEILLAYRGQSHVEAVFRQCKDDEHLAVRPQFHWTDQKIQVHAFICLLALLLVRVVEREARKHHRHEGASGLLDMLATIRLAMILRPSTKKGGRPRAEWQLEETEPEVDRLFRALVPPRPPFVYTARA